MNAATRRSGSGIAALTLGVFLSVAPVSALEKIGFNTPGADDRLRSALIAASALRAAVADETREDAQDLLAAARTDYNNLVSTLYEAGHYSGTVSIRVNGREAATIPPLDAPAEIREIKIRVVPGPVFALDRARIAPVAPGTELPEGFRPGGPAGLGILRTTAEAGIDGWRNVGHAKAEVADERIVANHATQRLDAEIALDPGPRLRFGGLTFRGDTAVRPERLDEIAGFPTGEVFSPDHVDRVATRLRRTGVFASVAMEEAEDANPDGTLDVTARLDDREPRRFGAGAEISSTEGATLSAYWLHRNLFRGAERLRFDAEVGGIAGESGGMDYMLGARFTRPATFTPDTSFWIESELARKNEPTYRSDSADLSFGFEHIFSDRLKGSAGLGLRYADTFSATGNNEFLLLTAPLELTWDNRDDPLDATEGYYLDGTATPFLGLNGSDSGARLTFDARTYLGLGDRFVLAGRVQAGSVLGAALAGTPPDFLFHSGGGGTVRGHSYQSLGVTQPNGSETGGRSLAVFSLEMRAQIAGNFGGVAFVDYGIVGADSLPGTGTSHAGAGLGLRYDTGIGPIRLDVATPISGPVSGSRVQVYIGIGQAF